MANMASVAYAIEGPQKNLEEILGAICLAMTDKRHWTEYKACEHLGFSEQELERFNGIVQSTAHLILRFAKEGGLEHAASF